MNFSELIQAVMTIYRKNVLRAIMRVIKDKASGSDKISNRILKAVEK